MKITSLQNEKVKYWTSLQYKKVRDENKTFLVEGRHLIDEALKNNCVLETISCYDENADYLVTKEILKKISTQQSISDDIAICHFLREDSITGNVLIIDRLQDPGNLGTIIRSAVAFNFNTIILSEDSVDQYNPKVIRSSEGMIFNVNILRRNLIDIIPILKEKEYKIIGTDVKAGIDIKDVNCKNIALVIGNEGKGMSSNIKNVCDALCKIKMNSNCESLNAGVAASILMYEVYHE